MALPSGSVLALDIEKYVKANSARVCANVGNKNFSAADAAWNTMGDTDNTLGIWVKLDSLTGDDYIWTKYNTTGNQREWYLTYLSGSGVFSWRVSKDGTTGGATTVNSGVTPVVGQWHFIAAYRDTSTNLIGISVDGESWKTQSFGASDTVYDSNADFMIGAQHSNSNGLAGSVAHAWWVQEAFSQADVDAIRLAGLGTSYENWTAGHKANIVGYWPLQEDSGAAVDVSGNGYDLTDNGSVTSAEGVTSSVAWAYDDGSSQAHDTGDTAEFGDTAFTLVVLGERDDTSSDHMFVAKWDGSDGCHRIQTVSTDCRFVVTESGSYSGSYNAQRAMASGANLMIARHTDGIAVRLHVNGGEATASSAVTSIHTATVPFCIGARSTSSTPDTEFLDGGVQIVLYINRDISDTERDAMVALFDNDEFTLTNLYAAKVRGTGDLKDIWDDIDHGYTGGSTDDLFGSLDLTATGTPTTRTGYATERLLTDVSSAGIDYQGSDGCPVYRWEDVGGSDNHGVQSTYASQPLYEYNSGVAEIEFIDNWLQLPPLGGSTSHTLGFYVEAPGTIASKYFFDSESGRFVAGINATAWAWYDGAWQDERTAVSSEVVVYRFIGDAGTGELWLDGSSEGTGGYTDMAWDGDVVLGARMSTHANSWDGTGRRVGVWNSALSGGDPASLDEWLEYGDAGAPGGGGIIPLIMHHRRMMGVS